MEPLTFAAGRAGGAAISHGDIEREIWRVAVVFFGYRSVVVRRLGALGIADSTGVSDTGSATGQMGGMW